MPGNEAADLGDQHTGRGWLEEEIVDLVIREVRRTISMVNQPPCSTIGREWRLRHESLLLNWLFRCVLQW
jgi:hypothetical protein